MALNMRDPETDRLARELARETGETITVAARVAIAERLARVRRHRPADVTVVDSSVLVAIVLGEPDAISYGASLRAERVSVSTVSGVESGTVVEARQGPEAGRDLDELLRSLATTVVPVDQRQADLAIRAWRRFGRGRHPAALNLGDCLSYALAQALDEPLLFKGEDFTQTDIRSARH